MKLLDGATAVADGDIFNAREDGKIAVMHHTFQVVFTGAPTALTVTIDGGILGSGVTSEVVSHVMTAGELTAGNAMFHLLDTPLSAIRAGITTFTLVNDVLTGTIDATASTAVVGVGTLFTTELSVGDSILVSGEERIVDTITDDLNLTVTVAFTDTVNDTSPEKVNDGAVTVHYLHEDK